MELCSNITIQDDLVIEEQQEQFGLMLFTSDSAVQFSRENAGVTITDNDSMCIRGSVVCNSNMRLLRLLPTT